jgi:N-methylhydantoinase B
MLDWSDRGKGKFRGGLGSTRAYRILEEGVRLSLYADRFKIPAAGIESGTAGAPGGCFVHRGDEIIVVKTKDDMQLQRGDLVVLNSGGGGGFGDPTARPAEAAALDRKQGYVTA